MMEFLDSLSLRPGVCFLWVGQNYDETVTLQIKGQTVRLGVPVAKRVWVAATRSHVTENAETSSGKAKTRHVQKR
jgi:hypothetical protein